jgi:hypothetical protein
MFAIGSTDRLIRIVLVAALTVASGSAAAAQTTLHAPSGLAPAPVAAVRVSGESAKAALGAEMLQVRDRRSDSLLNGALIGAGAGIASGLFLCTRTEPWRNCRDDAGPIALFAAIGAGIGIGIDALIQPRVTVFQSKDGSTRLEAAPIVGREAGGARLTLAF